MELEIFDQVRIVDTAYCSAIRSLQDLFYVSKFLRSRVAHDITDPEIRGISVAHAIEETLASHLLDQGHVDISEIIDENGKRLVFLNIISPFCRGQNRDQKNKPNVISLLLPDKKFNLSELAVALNINIEDDITQEFGPNGYHDHLMIYKDSVYIDMTATQFILLTYQPFLLISLSFSVFLVNHDQTAKVKGLLAGLGEELRKLEENIVDELYSPDPMPFTVPRETTNAYIEMSEQYLNDILTSEDSPPDWHGFHNVNQAFQLLLGDEKFSSRQLYPLDNNIALQMVKKRLRKIRKHIYTLRMAIPES